MKDKKINTEKYGRRFPSIKTCQVNSLKTIRNWLEAWNSTSLYSFRVGLLHELQKNDLIYEREIAIPFLLGIADGYLKRKSFISTHDSVENSHGNSICRQKLAEKALSVLCVRFFKTVKGGGLHNREWSWILNNQDVLDAVLWFFRINPASENQPKRVCNVSPVPSGHEQQILLDFLREFVHLSWKVGDQYPILISTRPQCIEIMDLLDWLDRSFFRRELDPASVEKLKEIALSEILHFPPERPGQETSDATRYRKACDLEEAVLGGSSAAYTLVIHNIRERQKALFKARYDASCDEQKTRKAQDKVSEIDRKFKALEAER